MEGRLALEAKPQPMGPKLDTAAIQAIHDAEALTGASAISEWRKALAGEVPHIHHDETRGIWRSWLDVDKEDPGYERAKVKGEWRTRNGAIRRMRNCLPTTPDRASASTSIAPQRPEPGGGSTSMLDAMAARRHVERGVSGSIKRWLSLTAYALAGSVVLLGIVLGLWEGFIRKALTPPRVVVPVVHVAPVAPVVEEEPIVEVPVLPAPRARRR